ncbi:MAG: DUF1631 family protein [Burkholderiales bacterium]
MQAPQTSQFDALLVQCRDLACSRLSDSLAAMLDKADESLTTALDTIQDQEERKITLAARDVASSQREVIEKQFKTRYLGEFQQRTNRVKKIGQSFAEIDLSSIELEIVGDDDLSETLKINDMGAKLQRYCAEELGALDQRVGVLLGDASLQPNDNPFSPEAICGAYKQACRNADSNIAVRMVLLKLFDDHVLDDVRAVYRDVNDLLVQNSILPKIRYGATRRDGKKVPGAPDAQGDAPAEGDFFAALQQMIAQGAGARGGAGGGGGGGASGGGGGGGPVLEGADLLNSLTRIQLGDLAGIQGAAALIAASTAAGGGATNVLHELKATSVGAGMGQMDAVTLDIVALLFDQLFDNPKIPVVLKGLIARLQIPMLKVAIADKSFFSRDDHPARQVLNMLGELALRLPPDFASTSPLYSRLETFMQELVDGFQEKIEIFETVRGHLEALIAEDDQRVSVTMQATTTALEQSESLALARAVGREAIKARVLSAMPPRPVLEFMAQQWIKYLVVVHVRHGVESDAWTSALGTVDQLVWSVAPKVTTEERRMLASVVPTLLKSVKAGIAAAGVEDAVCFAFFKELMKCHTAAIQGPPKKPVQAATASATNAVVARTENARASGSVGAIASGSVIAKGAVSVAVKPAGAEIKASGVAPAKIVATAEAGGASGAASRHQVAGATASGRDASKAVAAAHVKAAGAIEVAVSEEAAGIKGTAAKGAGAAAVKPPGAEARTTVGAATKTAGAAAPAAPIAARVIEAPPPAGSSEDLDFTAPITIKNPFGEGEVQVDELDFTATTGSAKAAGNAPARKPIDMPRNIVLGCWVEILEPGGTGKPVSAKLHYVSPLQSRFLFVDRRGTKVYECSRAMLAMRLNVGEVKILAGPPDPPLFENMMSGVFKKMGKPVPA